MPHSEPLPEIGPRCHQLRVNDAKANWRIVYRVDQDAIVLLEAYRKTTKRTPQHIKDVCRARLSQYDSA